MRRPLGFAVALAALAAAIVIGVIGGRVAPYPDRVPTSGDSFTLTAAPDRWTGSENYLMAGGFDGGAAISYLKFDVTLPESASPQRAWLWLGTEGGKLPSMIELSHVPDTGWREEDLTAATAPRLGKVVSSVEPAAGARAVAFDVTAVVRETGRYAFAVTAPSGKEVARFRAREAKVTETGAPTITLEWTGSTSSVPPSPRPPTFTPSPRSTIAPTESPAATPSSSPTPSPSASASWSPSASPTRSPSPSPVVSPWPSASPTVIASASVSPTATPSIQPQSATPSASPTVPWECVVGPRLVPECGALWGVAPGAHTRRDRGDALLDFEELVGKPQLIYHAYHRGDQIFPTPEQIALARDPANPRILLLNWKPLGVTWAQIAKGDRQTDGYLHQLAEHIKRTFPEPFFFTVHHEPENDVREHSYSGMRATDYAAAFRYVIKFLRAQGVTNLVSTMCYMAYTPWNVKPWFDDLYPGDDVVDWVAWDIYAYSDPGYGFGDFAEMMNRDAGDEPGWPGFYNWAARTFPDKPLMLAEWGVWFSGRNPDHHATFFESARLQLELFPRVKAYVYFESPDAEGRDSRVHNTALGLDAFQRFSDHPAFTVTSRSS